MTDAANDLLGIMAVCGIAVAGYVVGRWHAWHIQERARLDRRRGR